jgi:hypothetical protein
MSEDPKKLELVDRLLREQPARRAPSSLQARVLAELNSRAAGELSTGTVAHLARPWWRKGFAHWPLSARAAFLIASGGFVKLALLGVMSVTAWVRSEDVAATVTPAFSWLRALVFIVHTLASMTELVFRAIPVEWLYGAVGCGVALYAALFGLGAVAYRALYVNK